MSYFAGRWARAQTLLLDRDTNALAVLKELADDFRDDLGSCRVNSYRMLALLVGFKKPDTASAAVARLEAKGLIRASAIFSADKRQIVGTRFELVGYVKDEWPEQRQGLRVWVETALAAGALPQRWWPKVDDVTPRADNARETDDARVTGVPRETGEGNPSNGVRVPRETGVGYPVKRVTNTGDIQGLTGNKQGVAERSVESAHPLNDDDLSAMASEENLFTASGQKVGAPEVHPEEEPPKKPKKPRDPLVPFPETLPDDWRALAEERRPEVDAEFLFNKMRTIFGPCARKTMPVWKRTFLNWLANERAKTYANNRSYYRGDPQPSPEILATIDYSAGTWGY